MLRNMLCLLLIVLLPTRSFGERRKKDIEPRNLARVQAKLPHLVRAIKGQLFEVRLMSVEVSNISSALADGVTVSARFGDGAIFPLRGPKKIPGKGTAVYTLVGRPLITSTDVPSVRAECLTCRK